MIQDLPVEAADQEAQETQTLPWSFNNNQEALQVYHAEFPGDRDSLYAIRELAATATASTALGEMAVAEFEMAVDEMCANIVEHSYEKQAAQEGDARTLLIDIGLFGDRIEAIITDHSAIHFDVASAPSLGLAAFHEEQRERGLGLDIIRHCVDKIKHQWLLPQGNQTRLVKLYSA